MQRIAFTILIVVHLIAGVVSGILSADQPEVSSAIFLGVVFAQASLLGIWAGLSTMHIGFRLAGFAVGTVTLGFGFALGIGDLEYYVLLLVWIPCVLVAAVTWIVRLFKGTLSRREAGFLDEREALQFSIRHLMLLTFVVACLTAVGKVMAPIASGLEMLARISIVGVCYSAVALAAVWAMLGAGRPILRSLVVVVIAAIAGVVDGYVINSNSSIGFWGSTTALQAIFLVASLGVVRWVGYRFVALGPRAVAQ